MMLIKLVAQISDPIKLNSPSEMTQIAIKYTQKSSHQEYFNEMWGALDCTNSTFSSQGDFRHLQLTKPLKEKVSL